MTRPWTGWKRGRLAALVATISLGGLLGGCGGSGGRSIVLYNGQHPELTQALVAAFEKQTGIHVRVRTGDGIALAGRLLQEGSASPADVYLTENSPELIALGEHRLLAKVARSTLSQVPSIYSSPSGDWVGVALRVSALAYDPSAVPRAPLPRSILELAQPQWKGKIAIAPTDSDFPPLVDAVIAKHGERATAAWLEGLKRNAQLYQTDESVVAAVNRKDIATGIINNYYWYRLRLEVGGRGMHSALYYFPHHDVGSVENISGAAVLASSRRGSAAQRFLAFLVSERGQQLLASGDDFEYPARARVRANSALPSLASVAPAVLGPAALGNGGQAAKLIQESGLA